MTFIIDVASVIKFIFKYLLLKLYKPLQFCSLPKNNTEGLESLRRIIDCVTGRYVRRSYIQRTKMDL